MDPKTMKYRIMSWGRAYIHRLNTGSRPPVQPASYPREMTIGPKREGKNRPWINLLLFVVTFFTTTFAGATDGKTFSEFFLSGLPYSLTLLAILLCHEFGHYFAARKFGVNPTLPYFIPFPMPGPSPGTMGAIIKTRSPIPSRKALLYIGAAGPLAGFIISLAASGIGIYLSDIRPLPAARGEMVIFGDSLLFSLLTRLIHGPLPAGHDIFLSPYAWAGWIGLLITSLNLMPIGQLDGSHVLYALIGRKQRVFGWAALAGLAVMAVVVWPFWVIWIVLTFIILMVAHPEVPEAEKLTPLEKAAGWLCMIILILTFVPVPASVL